MPSTFFSPVTAQLAHLFAGYDCLQYMHRTAGINLSASHRDYVSRTCQLPNPDLPIHLVEVSPYPWHTRLFHVDVNAIFAVRKVLGLTLPTLDKPRVTSCERTACTVEWTSSFVKQGQDQTRLGFNLSFVPAAATTNASSNAAGHGSGGGGFLEASERGVSALFEGRQNILLGINTPLSSSV